MFDLQLNFDSNSAARGPAGAWGSQSPRGVTLEERQPSPAAAILRFVLAGARAPVEAPSASFMRSRTPISKRKLRLASREPFSPRTKATGPRLLGVASAGQGALQQEDKCPAESMQNQD